MSQHSALSVWTDAAAADAQERAAIQPAVPGWRTGELRALASQIDRDFQSAGVTLERVLTGLSEIRLQVIKMGRPGQIEGAQQALGNFAAMLCALPDRHRDQLALLDEVRTIYWALNRNLGEIRRIMLVLGIYGVNVKIVATGSTVGSDDLIHNMTERLERGGINIERFGRHLTRLQRALEEIFTAKDEMTAKYSQFIPAVPNQLSDAGQALDSLRNALAETGYRIADTLRQMEQHLASALVGMQVGDFTRQRLEHVATGIDLLEGCERRYGVDVAGRGHAGRLLRGLLGAAGSAFADGTGTLDRAFDQIVPCAGQLRNLRVEGAAGRSGQDILIRLEQSVKAAEGIVAELDNAERMMASMIDLLGNIVAEVASSVDALAILRRDVQQLAINIGLSYSGDTGSGKAAKILAGEIHVYSRSLDNEARAVTHQLSELSGLARRIAQAQQDELKQPETPLGDVARTIQSSAEAQACDVMTAGTAISQMLESIASVGALLSAQSRIAADLERCGQSAAANDDGPCPSWFADEFLAPLYACYTTAEERNLHRSLTAAAGGDDLDHVASPAEDDTDFTLF